MCNLYFLSCDTVHAANPALSAIPLSVSSRLEEDSVPNFMPCHMQPTLQPPLIGRCWIPSREDHHTVKGNDQPSVATDSFKIMPDLDDVKKHTPATAQSAVNHQAAPASVQTSQAPANLQTDTVDSNTQTG